MWASSYAKLENNNIWERFCSYQTISSEEDQSSYSEGEQEFDSNFIKPMSRSNLSKHDQTWDTSLYKL